MSSPFPRRRTSTYAVLGGLLLVLLLPATAFGHAELDTSTPAEGTTVDGPFAEPIVLTFTEALAGESGAELRDSAGLVAATATVDGDTITITPDAALGDGDYAVEWTAIADDGHIERGTVRFTVAVPATPEPTPTPSVTPAASVAASATPASSPSATATPVAPPAASPGGPDDPDSTGGSGDVVLPIVLGALLVGGLAVLLLRRRDSTTP